MATYRVKAGDSPDSIAFAFTGDRSRMRELVTVNVRKPRTMVGGVMTFQSLTVNELLQVPSSWISRVAAISEGTKGRLHGVGLGAPDPVLGPLVDAITNDTTVCNGSANANVTAFQQAAGITPDGLYGPATAAAARNANDGTAPAACSQYLGSGGSGTLQAQSVDIATAANAVINDPSICTPGPTPNQTANQHVLNFQHAYNLNGGPNGGAPAGLIDEDSEFGPGTLAALNTYSAANNGPTYALACANGVLAQAASSGGGSTSITPTGGATTVSTTSSSSSSGESAIIYGGLALLAGAAAFWYLNKKHGAAPAKAGAHKAAAHRVGRGRAKRKAARRRR